MCVYPLKGQKISNPGQIQDRVKSRTHPEIKDCPEKSRTDGHLKQVAV